MNPPRVLPVGDAALAVELGDALAPEINARVRALDRSLAESPLRGIAETVPTYRSLLVLYDPAADVEEVRAALLERVSAPARPEPPGPLRAIPTCYDGEDLGEVARARGLSEDQVVALHSGREYTAFMLGFMPGFAYLGLLPEVLETPRRATPRVRVPAGSVAVAGRQTGVYPVASPGGWILIGRTSLRLFDPHADPPVLIHPGDRVRFDPVADLPAAPDSSPPPVAGVPAVEVVEPGLLTTVQDGGRGGFRRLGIAGAGPMDRPAHRAANLLVRNPPDAAALEATVSGPTLRFLVTTQVAVTGADLGAVLHRSDLGEWPVPLGTRVLVRAGTVLAFAGRRSGCRAYVAFAGGLDVPAALRSRSTDLAGGFGGFEGRALRAGDRLPLGPPPRTDAAPGRWTPPQRTTTVRVLLGPQADALDEESLARLLSEPFLVGASSDRVGCRLEGPLLRHRGSAEIVTDGMVPGSVQVPPDGKPIVMMTDGPTTGGYPKVATVITADLPILAQALPGADSVRFAAASAEEARRARRAAEAD